MKRNYFVAGIAALMLVVGLAGCSFNIDDSLVGEWYVDETHYTIAYEFKKDGSLVIEGQEGFKYTASGGKLTLTGDGEKAKESATYVIEGNKLTISGNDDVTGFQSGDYYKK